MGWSILQSVESGRVSSRFGIGFRIFFEIPEKQIFFSPFRNCYLHGLHFCSYQTIQSKKNDWPDCPLGGPIPRTNTHRHPAREERPLLALCPLISSWKENLSLSSHPRVSASTQGPLELPWASGRISGCFFTSREKSHIREHHNMLVIYIYPNR